MSVLIAAASRGPDPARPDGRLRDDPPAAPGDPPVPLRPAVLRRLLAALGCAGQALRPGKRRGTFLSLYGPLSILWLFTFWAAGLIAGFALLQWSLGSVLHTFGERPGLGEYGYLSGVTFFTLGFGDVTPARPLGRFLAVVESGIGFGFLAVVISYLPVLYQAFSRREVTIACSTPGLAPRRPRPRS